MRIGLFAGIMVLIGDMLLGWGVSDPTLDGMETMKKAIIPIAWSLISMKKLDWTVV